jgi:hypothetical protein
MDFAISNPIVVTCFIIALLPTHPQIMLREGWGEPSTSSEADVGSGTSNSFVTDETEAFRPASPAQPQGSHTRGLARRGPRVSNLVHLVDRLSVCDLTAGTGLSATCPAK